MNVRDRVPAEHLPRRGAARRAAVGLRAALSQAHRGGAARRRGRAASASSRARSTPAQDARLAYYEWVRAQAPGPDREAPARCRSRRRSSRSGARRRRSGCRRPTCCASSRRRPRPSRSSISSQNLVAAARGAAAAPDRRADDEPLAIGEDIRGDIAAPARGQLDDADDARRSSSASSSRRSTPASRPRRSSARPSARTSYPRLSAFAVADYADPEPARVPADGRVQVHVVGRRPADLDAQRHARWRETHASAGSSPRPTSCAPIARTSSAARASRCSPRSRRSRSRSTRWRRRRRASTAAEESYRVRRELLAADRATAVELVDAETDLTRARIASLNARVDLRVALRAARRTRSATTTEVAESPTPVGNSVQRRIADQSTAVKAGAGWQSPCIVAAPMRAVVVLADPRSRCPRPPARRRRRTPRPRLRRHLRSRCRSSSRPRRRRPTS